jgi:hypothetical protein
MALALYWAVSTGLSDTLDHALPCEKRPVQQQPKKSRPQQVVHIQESYAVYFEDHSIRIAYTAALERI